MASSIDPTAADRAAIEALLAAQVAAWNAGDAEAFAARTLPDMTFTNVVGMFSVGRQPFVVQHERIFATIYQGSTMRQTIAHLAFLRPDVAVVDTIADVLDFRHAPPGVEPIDGAIRARLEQVLVRNGDGWWVASFHNVAVNAAAVAAMSRPAG